MRNKRLLQFLVLACLVLGAVPVLAGTVSLNATHDFSVGITGNLNFDVVTLTAAASGYASYPEQNPDPVENTSSGAGAVDANLASSISLQQTYANTAYAGGNGLLTLTQTMVGNAPVGDPINGFPTGILGQQTANSFRIEFDNVAPGTYTVTLSDVFNLAYGLTGNTPPDPYFYNLVGYSDVYASLSSASGGYYADSRSILLNEQPDSFPNPLVDFSDSGIQPFDPIILSLTITGSPLLAAAVPDTLFLDVSLITEIRGESVPLPGTLPLLGSGLGALLLGGRRLFRR